MKWKISVLMLFFAALSFASAQDLQHAPAEQPALRIEPEIAAIHHGWPPFVFELIPRKNSVDWDDNLTIKITGGPKGFREQIISASVEHTERTGFQAVDVNFDGYSDFSIVWNWGNHANECRVYWTFDPAHLKFVQASQYDSITSIDTEHKLLISYSRASGMEFIKQIYRVKSDNPVIVESVVVMTAEEAKGVIPPDYKEIFVQIIRIYVHGKLRRTFYREPVE